MAEHYQLQVEKLGELEQLSDSGTIDLYYGDESHVCSEGYVPYGWQFPDEEVCILSGKAYTRTSYIVQVKSIVWDSSAGKINAGGR
jgi:hypothetical protein